jgi:hypothetical protein
LNALGGNFEIEISSILLPFVVEVFDRGQKVDFRFDWFQCLGFDWFRCLVLIGFGV